jgi:hypothetical protein
MFEKSLKEKLQRIFEFKKATFDLPSETQEQECLFIQVESARPTIKDGRELAYVTGRIRVFANADKLPFGYFMKKLKSANQTDTKDLFFFDFEENAGTFRNVAERSLGFIYFFDSQYDPNLGTITSIEFGQPEEPEPEPEEET